MNHELYVNVVVCPNRGNITNARLPLLPTRWCGFDAAENLVSTTQGGGKAGSSTASADRESVNR